MRALTINQPYAHLVCYHEDDLPEFTEQKHVENRTRRTHIRGQIAIHAGVSMKWFRFDDWTFVAKKPSEVPEMAFGAIIGVADIVDCVDAKTSVGQDMLIRYVHASGPFMYVLKNVHRLEKPIPCKGAQGFWTVPEEIERQVNESGKIYVPFDS